MDFKSLKNIENRFLTIRLYTLVFSSLCVLVTVFSIYKSYDFAKQQREKIYVLDKGKSLMLALSQDASINRPVEAREHLRRFHEFFFSISPEKAAIESNMQRAFNLSDKSAFNYYQDLLEKGYYSRIISGGIQQRVSVDSIWVDFKSYPYKSKVHLTQHVIRASSITQNSIITSSQLLNAVRSDNNPQGFIIEKFTVLENKTVSSIKR
ncbi:MULTISPECIES: conjugative transposon protein TraK [Myroides]|uniref:Conjugative transposon protein TraK n=1 Tax=Myroides albus TaxID=2562892 RepID=A0A6I3LNK9_9FLAO|nr:MULTISPECIES: conjugative transposon protein TraK [Myroides]MTG99337.1 conjugative transposon protein TraK [Myroides albus]MVX35495.1 conjugative transposon protein TraK [Myroides sp. LoEW2-1]UVD79091.1 conjugative transposon protein TraK [Myroides albus]